MEWLTFIGEIDQHTDILNKSAFKTHKILFCSILYTWEKPFCSVQTFRIRRAFNTPMVQSPDLFYYFLNFLYFISLKNNLKEVENLSQGTFSICGKWRIREMFLSPIPASFPTKQCVTSFIFYSYSFTLT